MYKKFGLKSSDLTPEGKKYFKELEKLLNMEVKVGFQSGQATYEDGTDLVEVAAYNELGTSDTPARPFMKQSWENHEDRIRKASTQANKVVNDGGSAETALKQLGVFARGVVQDEIRSGKFEPNAESTIRRKGSNKPLIDTGFMRQNVNYVIEKKE